MCLCTGESGLLSAGSVAYSGALTQFEAGCLTALSETASQSQSLSINSSAINFSACWVYRTLKGSLSITGIFFNHYHSVKLILVINSSLCLRLFSTNPCHSQQFIYSQVAQSLLMADKRPRTVLEKGPLCFPRVSRLQTSKAAHNAFTRPPSPLTPFSHQVRLIGPWIFDVSLSVFVLKSSLAFRFLSPLIG